MFLQQSDERSLPLSTRRYLSSLSLELAEDDGMYADNDRHYLSCGESALNTILAALTLADGAGPTSILDFGAGAGRATRWLRAAFPESAIDACDLRAQDMVFCEKDFGATTWISGTDITALEAPRTYDLIWLGSVATHLSAANTNHLLDTMLSWTNPAGLVVMSMHGRFVLQRQDSGELVYIDDPAWQEIKQGFAQVGYGYADYDGQPDYGISVTKLSWTASAIESRPDARLVMLSERAWDEHQDVVAVQAIR